MMPSTLTTKAGVQRASLVCAAVKPGKATAVTTFINPNNNPPAISKVPLVLADLVSVLVSPSSLPRGFGTSWRYNDEILARRACISATNHVAHPAEFAGRPVRGRHSEA